MQQRQLLSRRLSRTGIHLLGIPTMAAKGSGRGLLLHPGQEMTTKAAAVGWDETLQ
jgi:hypothetical protein